ncbi:hypothetical protein GL218_00954 [Daldinia childiae]|uniref:uncharacterized protein n=1 Tax=Daldinia childiae TaxID=326645 RepID=UPI0014454F51|nr:uncharacterized protein GL218_00954 [Daldinia childiae]KAF3065295.1 hypothetical protein GL218_00954 [Daldinia childiae]
MSDIKENDQLPRIKHEAKVIRPLGYLELFEAAMLSLDLYRSSMLTCRFTVPATLLLAESQVKLQQTVESAISQILLKHPLLRVGLRGEHSRKPVFVELDEVDFSRHIEWRHLDGSKDYDTELEAIIKSRLNIKVEQPETAPAWRILMLSIEGREFIDIMWEWGHSHTDGISAKIFHEDMLRHLNDLNNNSAPEGFNPETRILTIPLARRRDLLPPLHSLCDFPVGISFTLATLWNEFKPSVLQAKSEANLCATWAPIRPGHYASEYRHFSISSIALQNIIAACRVHGTTLTGLLQALAHASLACRLSDEQARAFRGSTIVNWRPLMKRALNKKAKANVRDADLVRTMGNFMTTVDHVFDEEWVIKIRAASVITDSSQRGLKHLDGKRGETEENFKDQEVVERRMLALQSLIWPVAKTVRVDLVKRLDEGTKNDQMGLMKFIPDFRALLKERLEKPRSHSVAVSNIGVIDGKTPSSLSNVENPVEGASDAFTGASTKWSIDRSIFSIGSEVHGAAFGVCLVAAKDGELYVSCDWQESVVSTELGEGLTVDLKSWLKFFGRDQAQ